MWRLIFSSSIFLRFYFHDPQKKKFQKKFQKISSVHEINRITLTPALSFLNLALYGITACNANTRDTLACGSCLNKVSNSQARAPVWFPDVKGKSEYSSLSYAYSLDNRSFWKGNCRIHLWEEQNSAECSSIARAHASWLKKGSTL